MDECDDRAPDIVGLPNGDQTFRPTRRAALAGGVALAAACAGGFGARAQQGAGAGSGTGVGSVVAPPAAASSVRGAPQPVGAARSVQITAKTITGFERLTPSRRTHGRLEFLGGMALSCAENDFGGYSGLVLSDDGRRMLAISDRGHWLMADIQYEGRQPVRIGQAMIGEVPATGGLKLKGRDRDAETLSLVEGTLSRGTILIGFERNHRIGRYPVSDRGIGTPLGFLKMPAEARKMRSNKGFEAVCFMRSGPLRGGVIAFSEEMLDGAGNHTGWLWPSMGGEGQRIGLTNIGDFAVTDLAALPDGSLIVLERRFRWLEGVKMRLRLIKAGQIKAGAVMEGEVLLEADMASEIDNMEGLAVTRDARGQTVLTLISDNNFNNFLQRTLLLQFALAPDLAPRAGTR